MRYILYDFFGTLVRYDESARLANVNTTHQYLESLFPGHSPDDLRGQINLAYAGFEANAGETLREYHTFDAMAVLLGNLGASEPTDQQVEEMSRRWISDWSAGIRPFDGLELMLDALDIPGAIVSNTSTPWLVPEAVSRHKLGQHFDFILTSIDIGMRKPHASIYEDALQRIPVSASDVLFVGDNAECDYFGPRSLGINAVLVSPTPVPGVEDDHRITNIVDLPNWLAGKSTP